LGFTRCSKTDKDEPRQGCHKPSNKGPADWFTGAVRIDPLFQATAPARAAGASVTFEPGARTAWRTHPLGQTLIVTAGCGWVQREGGSDIEEIHPGDVIWFPPGEKHWHGARPTTAMTHIAIQENLRAVRSSNGWKGQRLERKPTFAVSPKHANQPVLSIHAFDYDGHLVCERKQATGRVLAERTKGARDFR
jgi:quercetin dioxygenase-like cupin family protein